MPSDPNSAITLREARYDTLFRGEIPYVALPDDAEVGIAGLCRITERRSTRPDGLQKHLDTLPTTIQNILYEHDLAAANDGEAIFGFINADSREVVGQIVVDVFKQWEVTCSRNKLDALIIDKSDASKWLVIETAAAVSQVISASNDTFNVAKVKRDKAIITKLIFNWGPRFVSEWFDGTIIAQWMQEQDTTPEEQKEWLDLFTTSNRKYFAFSNNNDPLGALNRVKNHLETALTDEAIATYLDWDLDTVTEIFTPGVRKEIAVLNVGNPKKRLKTTQENLRTMTDEYIAELLSWDKDKVVDVFTSATRRRIAINSPADLDKTLNNFKRHFDSTLSSQNIARYLGWTEQEADTVFTPGLRKALLCDGYVTDPLEQCRKVLTGKLHLGHRDTQAFTKRLMSIGRQLSDTAQLAPLTTLHSAHA